MVIRFAPNKNNNQKVVVLELSLGGLAQKNYPVVTGLVEGFIFRFRV